MRALIFTDERNPDYLSALISAISRAYGREGAAQLGDPVIASILEMNVPLLGAPLATSNYMTYAVGNNVFKMAGRQLKFGWGSQSCYREECAGHGSVEGRPGEENACKDLTTRF